MLSTRSIILSICLLISIVTTGHDWTLRAEARFENTSYRVYTRPSEAGHDEAKVIETDISRNKDFEFHINPNTNAQQLNGTFEFQSFMSKVFLGYTFTHHNSVSVYQIFDLSHRLSDDILTLHTSMKTKEYVRPSDISNRTLAKLRSTPQLPLTDSSTFVILTETPRVSWSHTENGNIKCVKTRRKIGFYSYDFEKDATDETPLLEQYLENDIFYFHGPLSSNAGDTIPANQGTWRAVFTSEFMDGMYIRISYLDDTLTNCHSCPVKVRADFFNQTNNEPYKSVPMEIGTIWGSLKNTFRVHLYQGGNLLSYEFYNGGQGNYSSRLYFFDLDKFTSKPIALYDYKTSVDRGADFNDLPQAVQDELKECAPHEFTDPNPYVHYATWFTPEYHIDSNGDLILTYTENRRSFEPLDYRSCREFLHYTLPNRTVKISGPKKRDSSKILKVTYGPKKQTGFDLGPKDGGPYFEEILEQSN